MKRGNRTSRGNKAWRVAQELRRGEQKCLRMAPVHSLTWAAGYLPRRVDVGPAALPSGTANHNGHTSARDFCTFCKGWADGKKSLLQD